MEEVLDEQGKDFDEKFYARLERQCHQSAFVDAIDLSQTAAHEEAYRVTMTRLVPWAVRTAFLEKFTQKFYIDHVENRSGTRSTTLYDNNVDLAVLNYRTTIEACLQRIPTKMKSFSASALSEKFAGFVGSIGASKTNSEIPAPSNEDSAFPELARKERLTGFVALLAASAFCFAFAFALLPVIVLRLRKFIALISLGSILFVAAFGVLRGPSTVVAMATWPCGAAYILSLCFTLYVATSWQSSILTSLAAVIQICCLAWCWAELIPGGRLGIYFIKKTALIIFQRISGTGSKPSMAMYFMAGQLLKHFGLEHWYELRCAHAVNSRYLLNRALADPGVHLIEVDVQISPDGQIFLAHPPNTISDLTLAECLLTIAGGTDNAAAKALKLDFKSTDAILPSIKLVQGLKCVNPIILNADILVGPGASEILPESGAPVSKKLKRPPIPTPVDATVLLEAAAIMPEAILSIGWTTLISSNKTGGYTEEMVTEMLNLLDSSQLKTMVVTIAVRACYAVESWSRLQKLARSTLFWTFWSHATDPVNINKVQALAVQNTQLKETAEGNRNQDEANALPPPILFDLAPKHMAMLDNWALAFEGGTSKILITYAENKIPLFVPKRDRDNPRK